MSEGSLSSETRIGVVAALALLIAMPRLAQAKTYYASPQGGGDGSASKPFQVASFWPVAKPGDTLLLLDGTYKGAGSMIAPTIGLAGSAGAPITVKAEHDGLVELDGEGLRIPVKLNGNSYFVVEGIDAHGGDGSVVDVTSAQQVVIRRVVGWDGGDGNTNIMGAHTGASAVLFEDVAGFGSSRKVFSPSQSLGHITFRRAFAMLNANTWGGQMGITAGYNCDNNIIENAIVTVHGTFADPGANATTFFGDDREYDKNNQVLGSIAYHTRHQRINGVPVWGVFRTLATAKTVRDVLVVVEGTAAELGTSLLFTAGINDKQSEQVTATHLTLIGGTGSTFWPTATSTMSHIIATQALWPSATGAQHGVGTVGTAAAPDYVMVWNNKSDYNKQPAHLSKADPQLVQRCGDLLQHGCSEAQRPKVDGQSVGAQIKYRYQDGKLTSLPLWPWPMNARIQQALVRSGYAQKGGLDGQGGTDLQRTIFELGGGKLPSFTAPGDTSMSGDARPALDAAGPADGGPPGDRSGPTIGLELVGRPPEAGCGCATGPGAAGGYELALLLLLALRRRPQ